MKTITKFSLFVIFFFCVSIVSGACRHISFGGDSGPPIDAETSPYDPPLQTGRLESKEIVESSGLTASKCQPDVFWTHNDSGGGPYIYAINSAGKHLGVWKVSGAVNVDWEDIAAFRGPEGGCLVLIGDIGDNERSRDFLTIYRVHEPTVKAEDAATDRESSVAIEPAESISFIYPDLTHDAETLMVHPLSGDIYVITKRVDGPAGVYKIAAKFSLSGKTVAEKIADLAVPAVPNGLVTGGDISPDGRRVAVCDYFAAYDLSLPNDAADFDVIWSRKPVKFDIGDREIGEAIAFGMDGTTVFATSEKAHSKIYSAKIR